MSCFHNVLLSGLDLQAIDFGGKIAGADQHTGSGQLDRGFRGHIRVSFSIEGKRAATRCGTTRARAEPPGDEPSAGEQVRSESPTRVLTVSSLAVSSFG